MIIYIYNLNERLKRSKRGQYILLFLVDIKGAAQYKKNNIEK